MKNRRERLTNERGQISEVGSKYLEKLQELVQPVFQEMMDNEYDYSDIRLIRDELMRFELAKMMCKRSYGVLGKDDK